MLKFIFSSLKLTLVIQACYEYHLTWARVPRIVREMSGNFAVSGEWSPSPPFPVLIQPSRIFVSSHTLFQGVKWKVKRGSERGRDLAPLKRLLAPSLRKFSTNFMD